MGELTGDRRQGEPVPLTAAAATAAVVAEQPAWAEERSSSPPLDVDGETLETESNYSELSAGSRGAGRSWLWTALDVLSRAALAIVLWFAAQWAFAAARI